MIGKINPSQQELYEKAGYWTELSMLDYWNQAVEMYPQREFVADDRGSRNTYSQMDQAAAKLAAWLAWAGIRKGDVVTYQMTPCSEFVVISIACLKAGAVLAPLGMCFVDGELTDLLNLLGSKLHICQSRYQDSDRMEMILRVRKSVPSLNLVVWSGGGSELPAHTFCLEDILSGAALPSPEMRLHGNDVAAILCTSGTTRGCKAVMLTHNNILFSELGFNRELGLDQDDIIFMPAPLNHATGFHHGMISPMLTGGKLILQERFDSRKAIEIINREKCTYSMGATPFAYDILKEMASMGCRLESLRFYLCGGAPTPTEMVQRAWRDFGLIICEVYGSTESVPHAFVRPQEALNAGGRWSGRAMEGVEIRVVDENGRDVPPGMVGEEVSRGPNVFVGYLNNPAATDASLDEDGWYYSGDLCVADEAGNIRIVGRKKDIIMRGGEGLSANEIDANLEGCPGILDRAVIGMPDDRLGERICVYVVPQPGAPDPTLMDAIKYLVGKQIHKRHWPERLEIIDVIPRTESGKVRKHLLVEDVKRRMAGKKEAR